MPNLFFFSKPVERILPVDLQAVALSYLSVDALNHAANTSKELSKAVLNRRPKPDGVIHKTLQVFRELHGIRAGFRALQQSDLPHWLKARWALKKHMLSAISQGVIALKINPAIPVDDRYKSIDYALALIEAWPNFFIFIHKSAPGEPNEVMVDALSLRALRPEYTLELLWNDKVITDQTFVLALLEIVEIFLSAKNHVIVQEGLALLAKDLEGGNILLNDFLSNNGLMAQRNRLLDFKMDALLHDSSSDVDSSVNTVCEQQPSIAMKSLDLFLSAPALLAYTKKYFSIREVIDAAQMGYENVIPLLLTTNGLLLLDKGFLSLASIIKITQNLTQQQLLAIVQLWLTDASTQAFCNGFISLNHVSLKTVSATPDESLMVECRALLTAFALDTIEYFVINLNDINMPAEWDDLLTQLNKSIDPLETPQHSPAPR